jgi:hypothetical protein
MSIPGAGERILSEVSRWQGVTSAPHRFGGVEFKLGSREIGHIHGDSLVDVPLPKWLRDELVLSERAEPHHVLPNSGWVSIYVDDAADVDRAIQVLQRSLEIAREQKERRATSRAVSTPAGGDESSH